MSDGIVSRNGDGSMDSGMDQSQHFPSLADRARASTRHVIRNGLASPTHSAHANFFRPSIMQINPEKRAKKIRFLRNGDRFHGGIIYAVGQEKFRTLEALMSELTDSPFCDRTVLPKGVRHIFTLDGSIKISSLDQLEDGETYVCCSTSNYHKVDYSVSNTPGWNVNTQSAGHAGDRAPWMGSGGGRIGGRALGEVDEESRKEFVKPRLITVVRNGSKPRKASRILLNKKTAHSFEQVMNEITNTIRLDSGAVKRIYAISGKQVLTLQDFFEDDDVFFAYGSERSAMDDFDLSRDEIQFINAYNRSVRQNQSISLKSPVSARRSLTTSTRSDTDKRVLNDTTGEGRQYRNLSAFSPQSQRKVLSSPRKSPILSTSKRENGIHSSSQNGHDFSIPKYLKDKYDISETIGVGNYAIVKECCERLTRTRYALKIINKAQCSGKVDTIVNEVCILRRIKHSNIIQLIEDFETSRAMFLVVELVTGGDLFDAITASTSYTERDASNMLRDIASAVIYLHSNDIVHRDIKPENILVHDLGSNQGRVLKLGDFGLAVKVTGPLFTVCGTPTYVAPEVLTETGYGVKVDVWSVGVVTYILLCGFAPFCSMSNNCEELFDRILSGKLEYPSPFWDSISSTAKDLISLMLCVVPEQRINSDDILRHEWLSDDVIHNADIHDSVSNRISVMKSGGKKCTDSLQQQQPGVSVITATALDKGSRYFEGRKNLKSPKGEDEVF